MNTTRNHKTSVDMIKQVIVLQLRMTACKGPRWLHKDSPSWLIALMIDIYPALQLIIQLVLINGYPKKILRCIRNDCCHL